MKIFIDTLLLRSVIVRILLLLIILFSFQPEIYSQIELKDSVFVYESESDSMNIISGYFDVYDSLDLFFFEADSSIASFAYIPDSLTKSNGGGWSNDILFLFNKDFDPTKMEDSIKIILQDNEGHCFYPPRNGIVTSNFGWRRWQFHYGMDIDLNRGDTVRSAFDGVIRISKWGWGYGNVIVVRHLNGLETLYGHLSSSKVVVNQGVKAGDIIGLGGSTGRSTGPHLHFEIRYLGVPINPNTLIDFSNYTILKDTVYLTKRNFQYFSDVKKIAGNSKYYKIKKGDTLSKIALYYGTNVNAICRLNGIRATTILNIGRTIRVR